MKSTLSFIRKLPKCLSTVSLLLALSYTLPTLADPLRIMALGDSITAGYTDNSAWTVPFAFGYRDNLYTKLNAAEYSFNFVGGSTEPWTYSTPPTSVAGLDLRTIGEDNHRGYGGVGISTISNNIANWLNTDDPDVVLLMIGINNITKGSTGNPTSLESSLNSLVHNIASIKPDTHLIVAQITPYAVYTDTLVQYNNYIANTLVPTCVSEGLNVSMVNQYDNLLTGGVIDPSLFSNGINHPNETAYGSMAQTWFEGIEALDLESSGEDPGVTPEGLGLIVNGSFETPAYSNNSHNYTDGIVGSSWIPTGCAGIDRGVPYGLAENCFPFEGSQMAFLQGDGGNTITPAPDGVTSLSQDVSGFVPGESYSIKFNAKAIKGYSGVNPFRVSLGGTELTFGGVDLLEPFTIYSRFVSDPIVATAENMVLKFYDEGNVIEQKVSWVDDVKVIAGVEDLVDDGGFETPLLSNNTISYQPLESDWNYEGCAGIGRGNVFGINAPNSAPAEGSQMAFLQGDLDNRKCTPAVDGVSKLQQDVSGFEIGESYTLSFETMGLDGFSGGNPFYVSIEGTDLFGLITPTTEYVAYSSEFIATSETMSLLFYDQGNMPELQFTWIDDISIIKNQPEGVAGDANNDGRVDGSDVTILAGNWQAGVGGVGGATWAMGDFNGDGAVDGSDVTILAGNWQYGVTATAASMPEPSTLVLILASLVSLFLQRKFTL